MNQIVENLGQNDDSISIKEIVEFVRESWKSIAIGSVVGLAVGAGYALVAPPKYLATAHMQTAKVAGSDVEAPALLVEKLKLPSYFNKETFLACGLEGLAEPGVALANALKPTLMKTAPIISISYKAKSDKLAVGCIDAVMADVRTNQAMLAKPIIEQKNIQLATLKQKLDSAEQVANLMQPKKQNFDFNDTKFSGASLLFATTSAKANEVKDLKAQISDIEIQLQEPQTKETYFTTPIYASTNPVEPKKLISLVGGMIGGAVLSVIYLIARTQYRKLVNSK